MRMGTRRAALAAAVCFGLIGVARAEELTWLPQGANGQPLYMEDQPPKPDKPLAGLLKKAGLSTGELSLYGFAEGSYTYDFSNPPGDFIGGRVFDIDNQEILLNQIDLSLEK